MVNYEITNKEKLITFRQNNLQLSSVSFHVLKTLDNKFIINPVEYF